MIIIGSASIYSSVLYGMMLRHRKTELQKWSAYNSHLPHITEIFKQTAHTETRLEKARREERGRLNIVNSPLPLPEVQEKNFTNMRDEERRSPTELGLYD